MTQKEALVAISCFVPFGPARIKLLVEFFGSATKVWKASQAKLTELGLRGKLASEFVAFREKFDTGLYFKKMEKLGVQALTIDDKSYPERLKEISGAPSVIYVKGEIEPQDEIAIAIVGSRKITSYGREMAAKISQELAANNVTIISGLALGVDAIAHQAALDSGGRTIAVLGNGLDTVYPPSHRQLAVAITQKGALVSEYPLGYPALPHNFPQRNRIISGLSLGVVVIEGTGKSGTLLTASHAANQGREVFAVPGQVTSPNSEAPHILIRQGAKLVTGAQDILEELEIGYRVQGAGNRQVLPETEDEKILFNLLEAGPLHIDEIVRQVEGDAGTVLATLTTMELKGMVKNIGSGVYQRI